MKLTSLTLGGFKGKSQSGIEQMTTDYNKAQLSEHLRLEHDGCSKK